MFVEVAFVVVALVNVRSVPESVAMVAVVMFATVAVNVSMMPVVARASEEKKFVVVALVTVAFVPTKQSSTASVPRRFVAKKFVDVDTSGVNVAVKYGAVTPPLEVPPPTERDPAVTVPPTVRSFVIVDDAAVSEPVTVALPPTERSPVRVAFSPLSVPLKFELFVSNGVV